ncbi:MAG: phosphatase PAP2 family protein [Thermoanaerobaculia bacterium]
MAEPLEDADPGSLPGGWTRRLRPHEWLTLLFAGLTAVLFAWRGEPFTVGPLLRGYGKFVGAISLLLVPAWYVGELRRRRLGEASPSFAVQLADYLRSLAVLVLALVAYTNLKCRLLLLHPRLFDRVLARLDAILHAAGGDLAGWIASFHSPARTVPFHHVYFLAWAAFALPLAVAAAVRGAATVRRALTALTILYIAGVLLYLAVPSLGPALVDRAAFRALDGTEMFTLQTEMLAALRYTVEHPHAPAVPFFGLAAFPSLHVATSFLGILVAWRTWRPLLVLLVPWNLAIAASAVYFGWHYILDFYPAIGLAWGCWWVAGSRRFATPGP